MANLHSLTNAQVARYHREAYRPDNMLFILSGTVDEADFLAALEQVRVRGRGRGRGRVRVRVRVSRGGSHRRRAGRSRTAH